MVKTILLTKVLQTISDANGAKNRRGVHHAMKAYHLSRMSTLPIVPAFDRLAGARTQPALREGSAHSHDDLRESDLEPLLVEFYATVGKDLLLAPYFESLDMAAHIPRIADFWSTLLFHSGRYTGNAFRPHLEMPGLRTEHFARWLATLEATLDASYAGPNTERMKFFAHRVGYSMQLRLGIAPATAYQLDPP
jgi:hemoglobin